MGLADTLSKAWGAYSNGFYHGISEWSDPQLDKHNGHKWPLHAYRVGFIHGLLAKVVVLLFIANKLSGAEIAVLPF